MLQELLKKYLNDDAKVKEFMDEMKTNKIFTSGEENLDIRYGKLKTDYEALANKEKESQTLITELKKSNGDNENLQSKIAEYETKLQTLEAEKQQMAIDNAVKFKLLEKGAKATDIDYLMFRIKQNETELSIDKEGNVKGLDGVVDTMQKTYSSNFDEKARKKVDVKDLPDGNGDKNKVTKEMFNKMGYGERNKLYQENQELYEQLSKGE